MSDTKDSGEKTTLTPVLLRFVKIYSVNIHMQKSIFQRLITEFSRIYCASSKDGKKIETQVVYRLFIQVRYFI